MLVIFSPILVLLASTALLVMTAWLLGWYRAVMLVAAGVTGALAGILAMVLLYRQTRERQSANRALRSVEARVSDIVESAMDPIITVDRDQRIVLFNAAAEQAFRWPREAVVGLPLDKLIPERFRQVHRTHIERFGQTGVTARRMGSQAVLMALRANGEEFPIEASISHHAEDGQNLFTVILRDVTARIRAEEALRRSKEELQELGLAAHVALEQEKSRIARELHDELAQALTALKMEVAWCKEKLPAGQDGVAKKLVRMQTLLDSTVAATRRIAADLRPLMLDDLGLLPALEWLVENFIERAGIPCELAISSPELQLQDAHSSAVFRIVQESLANIGKHARASHVEVAIEHNGAEVTIAVRDDGVGFSPHDPRKPNSFGHIGLRERASLLGGKATITSAPGHGTTIEVRLPMTSVPLQS